MMLHFPNRTLEPCRVFCIGCNYAEHMKELGDTEEDKCIIFMKPATSLVLPEVPVRMPPPPGELHHEVELVVAIGRSPGSVNRQSPLALVAGVTLGLDLTRRDVQKKIRENGHPWELCKSFEQSAPLGHFTEYTPALDLENIAMTCRVNGQIRQQGNTRDMLFPVARLIEIVGKTWALREGDVIFTGTPPGVGPLVPGDRVEVSSPQLGTFAWPIQA
jgi:2-keto-4-pentenoate hydratase/2-oxohepta-3-ene-1,7-dioic acid hydratase in catechol pathway